MIPTEEASLISQLGQPQHRYQAFEQIVNRYSQQLYWQIRRMVYSHDDANDILQNTFIKAWTNLDSFRGDARISTWLYRIALNETLNFLQRRKETAAIDDTPPSIIGQLTADDYFDGDETEMELQQAISTLPDKQRAVFQLKYYQEMKYEEMSEVLDTSVGALKASYHHAVKKICDFFKSRN
ncbi:MAG: sigma-70 family RNA polymerase sigma factor [Paraprevotella sp.]|nr:sigma-70 family RNA polymerase sigma factor [Paraprevotella sp.]